MPGHAPERFARLRWLVRLRWLALAGVTIAGAVAVGGLVPGVNVWVMAAATILGVAANLWIIARSRHYGDTDDAHVGQALFDTGALTLVIWAAGGADCPFVAFYIFPVLLAALLGGRRALVPAGAASAIGLAFQIAAVQIPALRVGRWDPPAPWDTILHVGAIGTTVAMAAYFAARFTEALRQQVSARREADTMLRLAFEGLGAGLEVIERGHIAYQNPQAQQLVGPRRGDPWRWPEGAEGDDARPDAEATDGPRRAEFARTGDDGGRRIYELLEFPLPGGARLMAIYLDRTRAVLDQRQLQLTERLASLGRTVQGVAHELNTPLATIQTLGRDILDAIEQAKVAGLLRADLDESASMIVAEVQRCRRITHALLGRAEHLDQRRGGAAAVAACVDRAVAVVYTHARSRVKVEIEPAVQGLRYPLDPLVQVLVNLLQNARDAAPEAVVRLSGARQGAHCVLRIRDEGPGLEADAVDHLFEPFFTTKPPGRGTGLGLYTSFALVQGLGGQLSLDDHPAGGALATIRLPVSGPSTEAAASERTP